MEYDNSVYSSRMMPLGRYKDLPEERKKSIKHNLLVDSLSKLVNELEPDTEYRLKYEQEQFQDDCMGGMLFSVRAYAKKIKFSGYDYRDVNERLVNLAPKLEEAAKAVVVDDSKNNINKLKLILKMIEEVK